MARLETFYRETVIKQLMERFNYASVMQVPKITKITVNMGLGKSVGDKKVMENALGDMTLITGQKPIVTKARKSIANFKLREGWPIGAKVTLRKVRMYEFLDRLISVEIPRIRDFRGVNGRAFDGMGNYTLGIKEHIIFPETSDEELKDVFGFGVVVVTSSKDKKQSKAFLSHLGFPFKKNPVSIDN